MEPLRASALDSEAFWVAEDVGVGVPDAWVIVGENEGELVRAPLALRLERITAASEGLRVVVTGGSVSVGVTGTVTVTVTTCTLLP